jgi:hypothetical protein
MDVKKIYKEVINNARELMDGCHSINFDYENYEVVAILTIKRSVVKGDNVTPDCHSTDIEVTNLVINEITDW